MTQLSHSFDGLVPYPLSRIGFELPDRRKSKHVLGVLAALCTRGVQAHVGQAGLTVRCKSRLAMILGRAHTDRGGRR